MTLILLQTHEQTPTYCTCTGQQAHVHLGKYRSIWLLACSVGTNTEHIFAHSYWELTDIFTHMSYKHYAYFSGIKCVAMLLMYACYLIITVIINRTLSCTVKNKFKMYNNGVRLSWAHSSVNSKVNSGVFSCCSCWFVIIQRTHGGLMRQNVSVVRPHIRNHTCASIPYQEIYPIRPRCW